MKIHKPLDRRTKIPWFKIPRYQKNWKNKNHPKRKEKSYSVKNSRSSTIHKTFSATSQSDFHKDCSKSRPAPIAMENNFRGYFVYNNNFQQFQDLLFNSCFQLGICSWNPPVPPSWIEPSPYILFPARFKQL